MASKNSTPAAAMAQLFRVRRDPSAETVASVISRDTVAEILSIYATNSSFKYFKDMSRPDQVNIVAQQFEDDAFARGARHVKLAAEIYWH